MSAVPADAVSVYYAEAATLVEKSGGINRALACLQHAEPARFARYRMETDRLMFLAGRLMARALVGRALGVPASEWQWGEGPHGRPEIAHPAVSLRFNIAHSAGVVACALADGRDVGVDVENRTRPPVDRKMVSRYCSPAEAADVHAHDDGHWQDRFLVYWTLKEAYLKARGLGISVPLAEITFTVAGDRATVSFAGSLASNDTRWDLQLAHPTPRHLMAIAASTHDGRAPRVTFTHLDEDLGRFF